MPLINLRTRQDHIIKFWQTYMQNFLETYRSLDNKRNNLKIEIKENPPLIKISAVIGGLEYLCMICFGESGTMQYSVTWYINEKMSIAEIKDENMQNIANQLLKQARIYFDGVRPSPDSIAISG
jgi:hypothetical protein